MRSCNGGGYIKPEMMIGGRGFGGGVSVVVAYDSPYGVVDIGVLLAVFF